MRQVATREENDFWTHCGLMALTHRRRYEIPEIVKAAGLPKRIADFWATKATLPANTTGTIGISSLGQNIGATMQRVFNIGAWDTIAADALKLPNFTGRVIVASSTANAVTTAEGVAKPLVKAWTLSASDLAPKKIEPISVFSTELIAGLTPAGLEMIRRDLTSSTALASDSVLLSALTANSFDSQGQDSFAGFLIDFREALRNVGLGVGSKPYAIVAPALMKNLAVDAGSNGYPALAWNGGLFAGVQFLTSDAQTANRLTIVDATGLAVIASDIEVSSSDQASLEMSDAPTGSAVSPTATSQVSMWQTGSVALKVFRELGVMPVRPGCFVHCTGIEYGGASDSPASI
jgi:hypothetical protein